MYRIPFVGTEALASKLGLRMIISRLARRTYFTANGRNHRLAS
jgi:hypothetical protein